MLRTVIACTMFVWDYILTLGMEVDLVWKSKGNFMKWLYLFQRYLPFIDIMLLSVISPSQMGGILRETGCRRVFYAQGVLAIIGVAVSEVVLTLRTWVVWNRNQRLAVILPIFYSVVWGLNCIFVVRFCNTTRFTASPYPGYSGCGMTYGSHDLILLWALIIIWDGVLLMLMLVPAIRAYRDWGGTSLMTVVYRDGVIYYLYLFVLACINLIVIKTLPGNYRLLLLLVARMIHSILTSRVVLHIRAQAGGNPVFQSDRLRN